MNTASRAVGTTGGRTLHIDGLRGSAITLVLAHHFVTPLLSVVPASPGAYIAAALTLTYTGVDLFFVLSGYLIGGILLDHRAAPRLFTVFYARRAARILPLAFLCIIVILGAQSVRLYGPPEGGAPWPLGVYGLFLSNLWMAAANDWGYRPLSQLWSLGIEEQFYLIAPAIICFIPSRRILWPLIAITLFAPFIRLGILALNHAALSASMLPFCRMDSLGVGMIVAWVVRDSKTRERCRRRRQMLCFICGGLAVGCAILTKLRAENGGVVMAAGGYSVVAAFDGSLLLLTETWPDNPLNRILAAAPLVALGRYSYFLYLFQGLVIGLAVGLIFHGHLAVIVPESWPQLGAALLALLAIAHASSRWVEAPFLAWGRRLAY